MSPTKMSRIETAILIVFTIVTIGYTAFTINNPNIGHTLLYPAAAIVYGWRSWSNLRYASSLRRSGDDS